MGIDLPLIWFLIIIFGVMMYVVMEPGWYSAVRRCMAHSRWRTR